jgi:Flp pilus assembly protein TadB
MRFCITFLLVIRAILGIIRVKCIIILGNEFWLDKKIQENLENVLTKKTWNDIIKVPQNLEKEYEMDNKSILEAARNNGDRGNEYELKENIRSSMVSAVVLLVVGMILFAIEYYVKGVLNVSLIILGVSVIGTDMLYRGIAFKKIW